MARTVISNRGRDHMALGFPGVGRSRLAKRLWVVPLIALVLAAGGLVGAPDTARAAAPAYGIAPSLTQVRPSTTIAGMPVSASLVAAGNETESFQIVVPGPASGVTVSGNLFGWNRTVLSAARLYTVNEPSDLEGAAGPWADALVPATDIIYGQARNAFPITVPAGETRVVWVDIAVPAGTPATTYTDSLTLTTDAGSVAIPVSLRVLPLALPTTASLKSAFYMNYQGSADDPICIAHTGTATCGGSPTLRRTLYSMYTRLALDNRISVANGSGLRADQSPTAYGTEWETLIEGPTIRGVSSVPAGAAWRLAGAQSTSVMQFEYDNSWHCDATCVNQWKAEATEPGQDFSAVYGYYACDEPGNSAAAWAACAPKANEAVSTWVRPTLVSASIAQYNANWAGSGMPEVTRIAPLIMRMHDKPGQAEAGDQRAAYNAFLATPGHELWLYTSCMTSGCVPDTYGSPSSYWAGWPGYSVDAPANQARAMPWLAFKYGATGELNWGVQVKLATAWTAGGLFESGANGDGTLFYPGTTAQIGGTNDVPLESIRLKRLRDGYEDYEYLKWLTDHGKGAEAMAVVSATYPTAYSADATRDGTGAGSVLSARAQLIALIDQVVVPSGPRIAFASDRAGQFDIYTMNPDGTNVTRLTTDPGADRFPAWSATGNRIAWTQGSDIAVMNADGSGKVNLTADIADVAQRPAWSRDGKFIVFTRQVAGHWEIWRMYADGSGKVALVPFSMTGADNYDPVVNDRETVFYSQNGDIYSILLAGGFPLAVLTGTEVDEVPDIGARGTMTFSRSTGGPYDIFMANAYGETGPLGLSNLTATSTGGAGINDLHSSLSPDDSKVVFAANNGGDLELWVVGATPPDPTGQSVVPGAVQITDNAFTDTDPDWGPASGAAAVRGTTTTTTTTKPTVKPTPKPKVTKKPAKKTGR